MGAERKRLRVLGVELFDDLGPEHTRRAHLGDLHEEVHADSPEERQTRGERVDIHAGIDARAQILKSVGKRIGQLDVAGSSGLLHVVAGDGDGVELGHVLRCVFEYIGDNTHRELRRIDIGVAHHELLEDIVLYRSGHFFELGTLFESGIDIESEYRKNGTVHGHRHRHLVEGYTVEEHLHVVERADRHSGLAHVAHHTRVVSVVTTVCGKVKRHRESLLTCCKVAAVESVGFGCGGESGVLSDSPGAQGVHGAVRTSEERGQT